MRFGSFEVAFQNPKFPSIIMVLLILVFLWLIIKR